MRETPTFRVADHTPIVYSSSEALVVQWIELLTPNEPIEVRFLARARIRMFPKGTASNSAEFAPRHSPPSRLRDSLSGTFFFVLFDEERNRTPEKNFSAEKFFEAVPRARERDGANGTRGRFLARAPHGIVICFFHGKIINYYKRANNCA